MHGELEEIFDFIKAVRPFEELDNEQLRWVVHRLKIQYFKRQQNILEVNQANNSLYIVRTGAVDVFNEANEFVTRIAEKGTFGFISLLHNKNTSNRVLAYEDCLVYLLSAEDFRYLCEQCAPFNDYFLFAETKRLRNVIADIKNAGRQMGSNLSIEVAKIITREPVFCHTEVSVLQAVKLMASKNVSTLMVVDSQHSVQGIFTDKDLRKRVVACNHDVHESITSVMSKEVVSIEGNSSASQASLIMMRHNIHHLPVLNENKPVGLISTTDLLRVSNQSPVHTISQISKAKHVNQLVQISQSIPKILTQLVDSGLAAFQVGQIISTLGESINFRLLQLAEDKYGQPPVDYCWLSAGSLGRQEQLLHSDQDNVLLLSNDYVPSDHDDYFKALCQFVSDGLNLCGYVYCPGNVMATNKKWCQPLDQWKSYFNHWINEPEPKALMYCSIFFDMRALYGQKRLFDELKAFYLQLLKGNKLFLSHLSVNALQNTPPLGFFRQFVLLQDKAHKDQLNLKKRGTAPIVDMARIYALSSGLETINSYNRLIEARICGEISEQLGEDLLDAYEFINQFRMKHQAQQITRQQVVDNFANPDELSSFERDHLHDAFKIVSTAQQYLMTRYSSGQMH